MDFVGLSGNSRVDADDDSMDDLSPNLHSSLISLSKGIVMNKPMHIGSPTEKKTVTIASPTARSIDGRSRNILREERKSRIKSNRVSFRSPKSLVAFHTLPEPAVLRYNSANTTPFGSPRVFHDATPSMYFYPHADGRIYETLYATTIDGTLLGKDRRGSFKMSNRCSQISRNFLSPKVGKVDGSSQPTTVSLSDALQVASTYPSTPSSPAVNLRIRKTSSSTSSTMETPDAQTAPVPVIEPDEATATTLMLRNVPNKYTRDMLLTDISNRGLLKDMDFFYMPIDLRHRCNVGYCFVNMTSLEAVHRFRNAFDGTKLDQVKSGKTCSVGIGKVQGLNANIEAYRNSAIVNMSDKYHPLLFTNGLPRAFPPPTMSRDEIRLMKPKKKKGVSTRHIS